VIGGLVMEGRRLTRVARRIGCGVGIALSILLSLAISIVFWGVVKDIGGDVVERLPPVPRVTLPGGQRTYVALGDSYSSGEGVAPYLSGTGDPEDGGDNCHRSRDAYAMQIEFAHSVRRRFRACSGARIRDMYAPQVTDGGRNRLGAQLGPDVLGRDVGLITITIGGNDLGFARVLQHCAVHAYCLDDSFDDGFDDGRKSGLTLREWAQREMPHVVGRSSELLRRLRRDAPNARILVLGYPNLFWTSWGDVVAKDCIVQFVFGQKEVNPLLELQADFSESVAAAAVVVGAEFIWTAPIFEGHEPCGAITPRWMDFVPLQDLGSGNPRPDPGAMHPNRNGHYILSRIVSCYLARVPRPAPTYDGEALEECVRSGRG
jgi:hypothetical protein